MGGLQPMPDWCAPGHPGVSAPRLLPLQYSGWCWRTRSPCSTGFVTSDRLVGVDCAPEELLASGRSLCLTERKPAPEMPHPPWWAGSPFLGPVGPCFLTSSLCLQNGVLSFPRRVEGFSMGGSH